MKMRPSQGKSPSAAMGEEEFMSFMAGLDANKDGKISKEELRDALRAAGVSFPAMKAWLAMRHVDADCSGTIDGAREMSRFTAYAERAFKRPS